MATPGIVLGKNILFLSNGNQVEHLTSVGLETNSETIDLTSYDSAGWKDIEVGDQDWSISIEAYIDYTSSEGYDEIMADKLAGTSVTCLLSTDESGDSTLTGTAKITAISLSGDLSSGATMSVTYTGTGALTTGTVS